MAHLHAIEGVELYGPRIRFQKMTRRGPVWFNEPLFPSYVFVRVNLESHQCWVASVQGVSCIVKFGGQPAIVPDQAIEDLRTALPNQNYVLPTAQIEPGMIVFVGNPMFYGLRALVSQVIPARARIKVLLEFLGRYSEIEIAMSEVLPQESHLLTG